MSGQDLTRKPRGERSAFTLVELMVVIAIIATLASMLLGAASLSMGTARQARTEALVSRLHTLLSEHYDSFRHRRVELNSQTLDAVRRSGDRRALAAARLLATREQLRMELPDRWSDILLNEVGLPGGDGEPQYLAERPAISHMFLRRFKRAANTGATRQDLVANQGAECLYLIIMIAAGDGESPGLFKESEIGDTDGDGAPEFIDGWGNPIQFLRWAPGFESDLQLNVDQLKLIENSDAQRAVQAVLDDRDPFDLFRVDRYDPSDGNASDEPRGFRLAPLIYSAGPDQEFGIDDGLTFAAQNIQTRNQLFTADRSDLKFKDVNDPYLSFSGLYLGRIVDRAAATDNIHNHYIKGR